MCNDTQQKQHSIVSPHFQIASGHNGRPEAWLPDKRQGRASSNLPFITLHQTGDFGRQSPMLGVDSAEPQRSSLVNRASASHLAVLEVLGPGNNRTILQQSQTQTVADPVCRRRKNKSYKPAGHHNGLFVMCFHCGSVSVQT